ncbi:MAG: DUF2179 domain-containing protein [Longimicrobiales bacterium]
MTDIDAVFGGPWGPLVIFCLRIVDVSLSTTRVLLTMRNVRAAVPFIAVVEVSVWILAVGAAIRNLNSVWHIVGYAGGFATGNLVGMWIESKLALGLATIRIISQHGGVELAEALRERGFGVTEFAGHGREGLVEVVYTACRRKHIRSVLREVDRWDPEAFVTVEEPRIIQRGKLYAGPRR